MKDSIKKSIPVLFQKLNHYESSEEDIRFLKVKIWLMHTLENLNNSYFSKEVVEAAIPTLANTPILAYIEENSDGDEDFSDHRQVLVKKDGKYNVKYIGSAIGVIPSDNNAQFEDRLCDDGVTRSFLTVEGLIWRKFDDPVDILTRDLIKAESMEIADDYEGEFKEDGYFHFSKFSFFGACGLGLGVKPAMQNASIEVQFSEQDFTKEVNEKMECFKTLFTQSLQQIDSVVAEELLEGGKELDKVLELLQKYSLTIDDLSSKSINHEELSLDELEAKIQETFSESNPKNTFSWSSEQLEDELRRIVRQNKKTDSWGYEYCDEYLVDYLPEEKVVIVYNYEKSTYFGYEFSINGDLVSVNYETQSRYKDEWKKMEMAQDTSEEVVEFNFVPDEVMEYKLKVATKEVESQFEQKQLDFQKEIDEKTDALLELNQKYTALEAELTLLQEFKSSYENNEKQEKISEAFQKFSNVLDKEELESFKEKANHCENADEFIKDLKSFACDKLLAKTNDKKGGHMFVGIPREQIEQKESDDGSVWSRLKNKNNK